MRLRYRTFSLIAILLSVSTAYAANEVITSFDNSTVSILNDELKSLRFEQQLKESGRLNVLDKKITNLATPTTTTDAVNKKYADALTGTVIQQVNYQTGAMATGATVMVNDDTIPKITEGNQWMSLSITPTSATNVLMIESTVFMSADHGFDFPMIALFENNIATAISAAYACDTSTSMAQANLKYQMTSGTTATVTFKVRGGSPQAGTVTFNGSAGARKLGGVLNSSMTITEIKP